MSETRQINARIPTGLHLALAEHKERTGEEKSEVIRRGIEIVLGVTSEDRMAESPPSAPATEAVADSSPEGIASESRPSPAKDSAQVPDAPSGGSTVDIAAWLSGRTGIPKALCRRHVRSGRVVVDGRIYREDTAPADYLLLPVTLDGIAV